MGDPAAGANDVPVTNPAGGWGSRWVDGIGYAALRLADGRVPWHLPAELSSFFDRMQGLLRSDVALVPLGDVLDHLIERAGPGAAAVDTATSPIRRLRALLSDQDLRDRTAATVAVVTATSQQVPVLLVVPHPGDWARFVRAETMVEAKDIERAAMYVTDFLRHLGAGPTRGLVIDVRGREGAILGEPRVLSPLLNVASHFRWLVFVREDETVQLVTGDEPRVVGHQVPKSVWSADDPSGFLRGDQSGTDPGLRVLNVPDDADPDAVQRVVVRFLAG